ncbi:MAG: hypothetical protein ACE5GV_02020 [Candidatus Scalindua sp.]
MTNRRNLRLMLRLSRVRINSISISFWFVLLLTLVGVEGVHGGPYEDVLRELRLMSNRINELEGLVRTQQEEVKELRADKPNPPIIDRTKGGFASLNPPYMPDGGEPAANSDVLDTRLVSFKDELIETFNKSKSPLEITGFFDFTLKDQDERKRPFDFGAFEMDLEYPYNEHYSVSTALVWDDGATPELAVGVVDYHLFDDSVPVRGRIFDEPGFHLQAGRFDIPYGVDYQYFASVDRPNVSAPLTTERIQQGGYNNDGIRFYGTQKMFDYTAYAVDSIYGDNEGILSVGNGSTVGGRIAFFPSRDPYRLHNFGSNRSIEIGVSYLKDMDREFDVRDRVYGIDLTLNYNMFLLVAEWMKRDSDTNVINSEGINLGEQDESGFHVSLVTDLEEIVKRPLYLFGRYDTWDPDYDLLLDADDDTIKHEVENLKRLTLGFGYRITELLNLKIEYFDYRGVGTTEPTFDDSSVTFQLTARY